MIYCVKKTTNFFLDKKNRGFNKLRNWKLHKLFKFDQPAWKVLMKCLMCLIERRWANIFHFHLDLNTMFREFLSSVAFILCHYMFHFLAQTIPAVYDTHSICLCGNKQNKILVLLNSLTSIPTVQRRQHRQQQ